MYVTRIPPQITVLQIFAHLKGAIFSFKLDPIIPGRFDTMATKVAFTTKDTADALYKQVNHAYEDFRILGQKFKVVWNRNKSRQLEVSELHQRRVIQIRSLGEIAMVKLLGLVHSQIDFELVDRKDRSNFDGGHRRKAVELRFQSFLGQSRVAMKCIASLANVFGTASPLLNASYVRDPCGITERQGGIGLE